MASFVNKNPIKLLEHYRIRTKLLGSLVTYPVIFVDCKGPHSVYFRTPELMKEFVKIHNALQSHFLDNSDSTDDPSINFEKSSTCAVKYDGRWYRAEVLDVGEYPRIKVSLLDKADSFHVEADEMRRLPQGLGAIPKTVTCCSFDGISETVWNEKMTEL